jgi:hypothetical protein
MPKLNRYQRTELRNLVLNATIRRLSAAQTQQLIRDSLQIDISPTYLYHIRGNLKRNCTRELRSLQQDRDYFLQRMFFDRVHEFEYQQKVLHEVIDKNKDYSPDVVVRAVSVLHAITVNMNRLFQSLPVSLIYIPSNGKAQQQQTQKPGLPWEDDPTFAGMPGSNLDENFQPRPKPVYDESDQP